MSQSSSQPTEIQTAATLRACQQEARHLRNLVRRTYGRIKNVEDPIAQRAAQELHAEIQKFSKEYCTSTHKIGG